jgi:glutamine amidotransferase
VGQVAGFDEAIITTCDYGDGFVAAIEAGPIWATQFHPEKSGEAGLQLLKNWVDQL